jgi:hypothetical protein
VAPGAGDGCAADHCQPCLQLVAELAPIADHGTGDRGICNGPTTDQTALATAPVNLFPMIPSMR